jgi:hypothetical protein
VHPTFYMPGNTIRMHIEASPKMHIIMFDANTPVDEHTTKTYAVQVRNFFKLKMFDKGSLKRLEKVLQEDTAIVEETRPFYLAETLENEVSVKSDRFMGTFRKMRRDLIEQRGWQIDTDEVEKYRGKKLFAIPSPARRAALDEGVEPLLPTIPLKSAIRSAVSSPEDVVQATEEPA